MMKSTLEGTEEWYLGKADYVIAYKNLAMRVSDIHIAYMAISIRYPEDCMRDAPERYYLVRLANRFAIMSWADYSGR